MSDKNKIDTSTPESLIATLESWFKDSERWMTVQRDRWTKNENIYNNEINSSLPTESTRLKFNLPLAYIETSLSIINGLLPDYDVMPRDENDIENADLLCKRKNEVNRLTALRNWLMLAIKDSKLRSNSLIKIMPILKDNESGGKSLESLDIEIVDLFTWFPAPNSTGIDIRKNSRYQIFAVPMCIKDIKEQYDYEAKSDGFLDQYRAFRFTEEKSDSTIDSDYALVKVCFFMDSDKAKYPNGRQVIWINQKVVYDKPLWDGVDTTQGKYVPCLPYFMITNYKTANKLFGVADTDLIGTLTKSINEVLSSLAEIIKKTANPIRKIKSSWLASIGKTFGIKSIAGENIEVNQSDDVTWESPPQIQIAMFNFVEVMKQFIELILGTREVVQGINPTGVTAASGIMALQEQATGRIKYAVDTEYSRVVQEIGNYIIWLLQTYDTEVRTIREQSSSGEMNFIEYDPSKTKDGNFDIEIVAGVYRPFGAVAQEQMAMEKFKEGLYGPEDFFAASSETDKQGKIQRWYERQGLQEAKQQMDAMAQILPKFQQAIQQLLADPEGIKGSQEEEQIAEMMYQMPQLITSDEFAQVPQDLKERLMIAVANINSIA